jgi:2-amino-4-hydroxy-6-hydroxymethyldihydropteridine diphosphokinase
LSDQNKHPPNSFLIGLGSNIQPVENIKKAAALLRQQSLQATFSRVWQSEAVGSQGPDFLNAAALIAIPLSARSLKSEVLSRIENQLGRERSADKNAPRTIDLDILAANRTTVDPGLWQYAHNAVPAAELLPGLTASQTRRTLAETAVLLASKQNIRLRQDIKLNLP